MSVREAMLTQFGPDALKKPIKADVFYSSLDATMQAFQSLKRRVEAIEAEKGIKPRVRVQAEGRRT